MYLVKCAYQSSFYGTCRRMLSSSLQRRHFVCFNRSIYCPFKHTINSVGTEGVHDFLCSRSVSNGYTPIASNRLQEVPSSQENVTRLKNLNSRMEELRMDSRRKGRIHRNHLEEIICSLENGADIGDHGITLLKYCSQQYLPDVKADEVIRLFQKVWLLIGKEERRTHEHLEALLQCYTDHEFKEFDPFDVLKEFESTVVFYTKIYYLALLAYCQRGDLANAIKVFRLVKNEEFLVDEAYFAALILGNSRAGDLSSAKGILDIMKSSQVNPSSKTFATLIQACIEHNEIDSLTYVYNMSRREASLTDQDIIKLASVSIYTGNFAAFERVLEWLPDASPAQNSLNTFNLILTLINAGHVAEAKKILEKWERGVHLTRQGFGVSFIKELIYANIDQELLISMCAELKAGGHNTLAFNCAAEFSLRKKQIDRALMLFKVMRDNQFPLRPHYFWPIIIQRTADEGLRGFVKALETMVSFEVLPDWETYMEHIIPKLVWFEANPIEMAKILKESLGVSYSSGIFPALLHYLLKQNRLADASMLAKKFKSNLPVANSIMDLLFRCLLNVETRENMTANIKHAMPILLSVFQGKATDDNSDYVGKFVIRFLDSVESNALASNLVKGVEKEQIPISATAAELIEVKIGRKCDLKIDQELLLTDNSNSNKLFTHPKDMDTRSLECHVQELKSKGMKTHGVLRRLFFKYCQEGDLPKALQIKAEFEQSGEATQGMNGALMALYVRKKEPEIALQLYKKLVSERKDDWNLDLHKFLDLITLLAESGRAQEASTLLFNDIAKFSAPEDGNAYTRNAVKLLEAFSKYDDPNGDSLTSPQKLVDFLLENQVILPSSPVFNIVIRHHLQKNEVEHAVELFEDYVKNYKLTPGNQVMAYAVLKDPELLDRYTKASIRVHGKVNTMHQLAYAFSDVGRIRESAQIFTELGPKLDLGRIRRYCDFLGDRRDVPKILNIAQSLATARENIDTSEIYLVALKSSHRLHDHASVQLILDRMDQDLPSGPPDAVLRYVDNIRARSDPDNLGPNPVHSLPAWKW